MIHSGTVFLWELNIIWLPWNRPLQRLINIIVVSVVALRWDFFLLIKNFNIINNGFYVAFSFVIKLLDTLQKLYKRVTIRKH